jgi:hypothetical protein
VLTLQYVVDFISVISGRQAPFGIDPEEQPL